MKTKTKQVSVDTAQFILNKAIPLFARSGYSGVSMRNIAKEVGISGAALYHHYPDKKNLYIAAMTHAFTDNASAVEFSLNTHGSPAERLERFISDFTKKMFSDPDFRALLQRELLDGDDERLKLLADQAFVAPFMALRELATELAPDCDAHLTAISMAGLILFHFDVEPIRRFLPGGLKKHNDSQVIAKHITKILMGAFSK